MLKLGEIKTNEVKIKSIKSEISANESKKALAEKEIEEILSKIDHYYKKIKKRMKIWNLCKET